MAPQVERSLGDLIGFAKTSPLLLTVVTFLIVVSFVRFLFNRPKKLNLPVVGTTEDRDHRRNILDGCARYPDSPFVLPTSRPVVILPMSVINETKSLPEHKLSFHQDVQRTFSSKHTGVGNEGSAVANVVRHDLTRHIASTLDGLQDEIRYGFEKEIGSTKEWTSVTLYPTLARIVALLSGRIFVGRPLSRNEEWIQATINYTMVVMEARQAISDYDKYPSVVRDLMIPRLPEVKNLIKFRERGSEILQPLLAAQLSKKEDEKITADDEFNDEQGTFIGWMLNHTDQRARHDALALANNQMGLSFAAIHTTTMTTASAIFDLCAHPELIPALREEIESIIASDGYDVDSSGTFKLKKSSMPKLWKLDSFLKESQRSSPPALVSNTRLVTSPLKLSTGHTLPVGTRVGFPTWAVTQSEVATTYNPKTIPINTPASMRPLPVSEFDGLRFYKLRCLPGNENKYQFVTTSPESLSFGHGIHACPGRFFAGNEIKVVLIEMLREWDFRFKGGVMEKPANVWKELSCMPNPMAEVEFRTRRRE